MLTRDAPRVYTKLARGFVNVIWACGTKKIDNELICLKHHVLKNYLQLNMVIFSWLIEDSGVRVWIRLLKQKIAGSNLVMSGTPLALQIVAENFM